MMLENKIEKLLIKAYEKAYESIGFNFHEIKEKNRQGWFMNYHIPQKKQEDILTEVLKKERNKAVCDSVKGNYHLGCSPSSADFKYKLQRVNDGTIKEGYRIKWYELDSKDEFDLIDVDRVLVLYDEENKILWKTSEVKKIFKKRYTINNAHFKTKNSEYKLYRVSKHE